MSTKHNNKTTGRKKNMNKKRKKKSEYPQDHAKKQQHQNHRIGTFREGKGLKSIKSIKWYQIFHYENMPRRF